MDKNMFSVVYFDTRIQQDCSINDKEDINTFLNEGASTVPEVDEVLKQDLKSLLAVFREVYACQTISACKARIDNLESKEIQSTTIVIIHIKHDERSLPGYRDARSPSPMSMTPQTSSALSKEHLQGYSLLRDIFSEAKSRKTFNHVIPVVLLSNADDESAITPLGLGDPERGRKPCGGALPSHKRYLDAGAIEVLPSPLSRDRVQGLPNQIYRATRLPVALSSSPYSRSPRKTSWVGMSDAKPYAYLREAMVSNLMERICVPDLEESAFDPNDIKISSERAKAIQNAIGTWTFSAHDFSDDELLFGAFLILQHAFSLPDLEKWQMPRDQVITFLMACRKVYNDFVIYHNFRHACDVLQATFYFLLQIGALPPYPQVKEGITAAPTQGIGMILAPFEALTLLVAAIGHDVGHPGVNNLFLQTLNAPLAQLYNDRSVLESFHCAAYSQILRRYWPAAFQSAPMRKLMIDIILATDMGSHTIYMADLTKLRTSFESNGASIQGWNDVILEKYRRLVCCLLIKCADICNVARDFEVATQWAKILTEEFANQGEMEDNLNIPSCLFGGPPVLNDESKMAGSQIGFMNLFAIPLFDTMSHILPGMKFSIDELRTNKAIWEQIIEAEMVKSTSQMINTSKSIERKIDTAEKHPQALTGIELPSPSKASPNGLPIAVGHASHFVDKQILPEPSRRRSLGPTYAAPPDVPEMKSRNSSHMSSSLISNTSTPLTEHHSQPSWSTAQLRQTQTYDGTRAEALAHEDVTRDNAGEQAPKAAQRARSMADLHQKTHVKDGQREKSTWTAEVASTDARHKHDYRGSSTRDRRKFSFKFWRTSIFQNPKRSTDRANDDYEVDD